jgi:DNA-binding NarL/FixJ family response regulator
MADAIKVVIVDDIAETRDHLTKLLSFESDINVVGSAASGPQALELVAHEPVDVLLLDINMPDMDGIATAEQLALRAPTAATIMMSVQGEPDYLRRAMLAGAPRTSSPRRFDRFTTASARSSIASRRHCLLPTGRSRRVPARRAHPARSCPSSRQREAWAGPRWPSTSRSPPTCT